MRSIEIERMMDYIDEAQDKCYHQGKEDILEEILIDHNASEDDSGEEGYFATMSDEDIRTAYEEIHKLLDDPTQEEYEDTVRELLRLGFREQSVMSNDWESEVNYLVRDNIAILVSNKQDIERLAKEL